MSLNTRTDIAFAVSRLAEANKGLSKARLDFMKHVLRYLKGTTAYYIEPGSNDINPDGIHVRTFADTSLADRLPSQYPHREPHRVCGWMTCIMEDKKRTLVALSTPEHRGGIYQPYANRPVSQVGVGDPGRMRRTTAGTDHSYSPTARTPIHL